jgi:hypothetical protein
MPDGQNQQIEGLPAGAIVKPIPQSTPQAAPQIEGLPPGAIIKPIQQAAPTSTPAAEPSSGPLSAIKEFGEGIGGGLLKTTSGIGSLIHAIPVVGEKIIPSEGLLTESQKAEELTRTPAQKAGEVAEAVLEAMAGDEALSGVAKFVNIAHRAPQVLELMERFPKTAKLIMGAGKGAATMAAQGAVKEARPGGEGVLEGAKAGAEGGALGGAVGEVVPMVAKPVAKAMGIGTTATEDVMRAAQPAKRNIRFIQDWSIARPRLVQELEEGGKFKDMEDAANRIGTVRRDLWTKEVKPAVDRHANEQLFPSAALPKPPGAMSVSNPIADAIKAKVTPAMQKVNKQSVKAIEKFSEKFQGPMTVGEAEGALEHMNAELDNLGYWKKTPAERASAEKANPAIASRVAATNAIRNVLYDHLESAGEPEIKNIKREYGALANIEKEVRGQVNVAGRQRPLSLKQVIGLVSGIAHGGPGGAAAALVPLLDKLYNEPTALLTRAIEKSAPPSAVKAAAKDIVSGAGAVAKEVAPVAGRVFFTASDGSVHQVNADQWDKVQEIDPGAKQVEPPTNQ